jgi:hypothetical protein
MPYNAQQYGTGLTHMPYHKVCMLGFVAGSGLIRTTTVSTWMMQPSTAGISGNIVLEDIPIQLMAICGMPQDHQWDSMGYCIMAAVNHMYMVMVDIPT